MLKHKQIRRDGIKNLNEGKSNVSDLTPTNPVICGGKMAKSPVMILEFIFS
jgi:hypothetical protein